MPRTLTQKIQNMITNKDVKMEYIFKIDSVDYSSYLLNWQISVNRDFGASTATFTLTNDAGLFGEGGDNKVNVGDVVELTEKFYGDVTPFKKFYGIVNQRSIAKRTDSRTITLICIDYIGVLQFLDIDLEKEGTKTEITSETLTPSYLDDPNDNLAQLFNFANDAIAFQPEPVIIIKNKNTLAEDPQYDGFDIYYSAGQLRLGFPLNAKYNYDLICTSYWIYTKGIYVEDVLEAIITQVDGYGGYLFGETSAQAVIDNHLTDTIANVNGTSTDTMVPNYTNSTITIETTLSSAVTAGATSITVADTSGFPSSGSGETNGDVFTWTGKTSTTLTGIPATGASALKAHSNGAYVNYEAEYTPGQVWYLSYSNLVTTLTSSDFSLPSAVTVSYVDKRFGRIILSAAIGVGSTLTCDTNYTFKTLQATGVELTKITFRSREIENRFKAVQKLREYLAPNYILRTKGDNKIWASYLTQKVTADYDLELITSANYLEDTDLYTRVIMHGKNKNPTNIMFKDGVDFVTTGEDYKAITTQTTLTYDREEGNYYVYVSAVSGVGRITANTIKPIVYLNGVAIDNTSHQIVAQSVLIETTTKTETTVEGGGK